MSPYTVQSSTEGAQDVIEKLISKGETLWKSFTGELQSAKNQRLQTVLTKAFTDGFLQWEQVLSNKMGLTVRSPGSRRAVVPAVAAVQVLSFGSHPRYLDQ